MSEFNDITDIASSLGISETGLLGILSDPKIREALLRPNVDYEEIRKMLKEKNLNSEQIDDIIPLFKRN